MFSECTTHYTDSTRSVFVFTIMFIAECPQLQSQLFPTVVDKVSTFGIVFLTEVSTAVVLQFIFNVSTSLSSVYVSLS